VGGGAHINNLLTVVVWKCVYDRIVYIVKKGINIFFLKEVFKGGHNLSAPPPTQILSYAPGSEMFLYF